MIQRPKAIFLMGPTAMGKTALAIELATSYHCEIISVDSTSVYRGLDIGSAKPDSSVLKQAPHHLIDILDPSESYSAYRFREDALALMKTITAKGKMPLLVGGTMLYFKALVEQMAQFPPIDEEVRAQLVLELQNKGLSSLVNELKQVDPDAYDHIALDNPRRVQRALEVYRMTGKPISYFWQQSQHNGKGVLSEEALEHFSYDVLQVALIPEDRSKLHQRIAERFQEMLDQGFEREVIALHQRKDLSLSMPSMKSVGYRQMYEYLNQDYDYQEMQNRALAASRQLAKRQLSWLRKWPKLNVFDVCNNPSSMALKLAHFLK